MLAQSAGSMPTTQTHLFSYLAVHKYNISYAAAEFVKFFGSSVIISAVIYGAYYISDKSNLVPFYDFVLMGFVISVLKGDAKRTAQKISIDMENQLLCLDYRVWFVIKRQRRLRFNECKINVSKRKSGAINKIEFQDKKYNTICCVDFQEGLFSEGDFYQLGQKLDELTVAKWQ